MSPAQRRVLVAVAVAAAALVGHLVLASRYPVRDAVGFQVEGVRLASALRSDPSVLQAWSALLFQRPSGWEHGLGGSGATDTMVAVSAGLNLLLFDQFVAVSAVAAGVALGGKWLLYRAFAALEPSREPAAFAACLVVPSVAFWTSGLLKEAFAMGALGLVVHGLALRRPHAALGALGLVLLRPWALVALLPAALHLTGGSPGRRWALAGALALLLIGGAELLPLALDVPPLTERLLYQQQAALRDTSASAAPLVSSLPEGRLAQLGLVPLAVLTAWFRPGLWESHTAVAVAAGLENALLVGALAWATKERRAELATRPGWAMALVFCALLGTAIGLTTANLGSLSRYRVLLAPFLWWAALSGLPRSWWAAERE